MYDVTEILDEAITDIQEVALHPSPEKDKDLVIEPIPALVELYSSTAKSRKSSTETEKPETGSLVIDTDRNITLTRFAGRFRRGGIVYEEILASLQAINENRCDPPLPEWEIEKISRSMMRYDPDDPALLDSAILSTPGVGVAAERKLRFVTAREISEQTPEEVDWVVRPYVARGAITEVDGKPKAAGKTTLVSHMVRAVVNGEPFLGEPTTRTGVVYLTEQSLGTFREVLDRADLLDREDLMVLPWNDTVGLRWEIVVRAAAEEAVLRGAGMLVVDTLPQFARLHGDAENNSGAALAAIQPLQEAAATYNLAVMVVRHERKSGGEVGDSARGSSAFAGAVDVILSVRRTEGSGNAKVRTIKALTRFDETPEVQVVELTAHGYQPLGDGTALAAITARAQIRAVLPTEPPGMDSREIVEAAEGVGRTTLQAELNKMVNDEQIVMEGKGVKGDPHRYWQTAKVTGIEGDIHSARTPSPTVAEKTYRVEDEEDPDPIDQIASVMRQSDDYKWGNPQELIDDDIFQDLDFSPTLEQVNEAQGLLFSPR